MKRRQFQFTMADRNHTVLLCWLIIHAFLLPMVSSEMMRRWPDVLGVVEYNVIYYTISTAVVLIFGWHYLRAEFDTMLDNRFGTIVMLMRAFFINLALSFFAAQIIVIISGGSTDWLTSVPGDESMVSLTSQELYKMTALSMFLAPVIEEVLFRGCIFGWLRRRDKLAAYLVSMAVYAIAHVWQYALQAQDLTILYYVLSFLPGAFVLAWCYDLTGSIWTGILFQIGTNMFGMNVLF